ncbi:MAG: exosortase system-associated protein, TIGR04073 family [Candidatus Omnitrophota bacterium]
MKKFVAILIVAGLVLALTSPAYAGDAVKKLGRGLANVATSPLELFQGMGDAKTENGIFAGLTWGILKGTVDVVTRAAVGVYEIATFPIPMPKGYDPILKDPEFILEKEPLERIK